jgi:hypothetical protein
VTPEHGAPAGALSAIMRKQEKGTMQTTLGSKLPPGWRAEEFVSTVEVYDEHGRHRGGVPKPYGPGTTLGELINLAVEQALTPEPRRRPHEARGSDASNACLGAP